jgi:RPA family protein
MTQDLIDKLFQKTDDMVVRIHGLEAVEQLINHRVTAIEQGQLETSRMIIMNETKVMESIKKISDKQDSLISRLDTQDGARQAFKYLPTIFHFIIAIGTLILMIRSFK